MSTPNRRGCFALLVAALAVIAGAIEDFPPTVLGKNREQALLFKRLATLRSDAPLFRSVDELRWDGPTGGFASWTRRMDAPRLLERSLELRKAREAAAR